MRLGERARDAHEAQSRSNSKWGRDTRRLSGVVLSVCLSTSTLTSTSSSTRPPFLAQPTALLQDRSATGSPSLPALTTLLIMDISKPIAFCEHLQLSAIGIQPASISFQVRFFRAKLPHIALMTPRHVFNTDSHVGVRPFHLCPGKGQ